MKNRILVFTGDGKGKTTAALGIVLRAQGHDIHTHFIQFMKSAPSGELKTMALFPNLTVDRFGLGFVPKQEHPEFAKHQQMAQKGITVAKHSIESNQYSMVILDEILGAIAAGLVSETEVIDLMKALSAKHTLVLTGRDAPTAIINLADTVTEMKAIKHGYEMGIPAQKGVEF